jgi:riboflavin biosynthesis pyrimidine reductase
MLRLRARADCVLNGSGTASAEQVHRPLPAELIVQRRERGQPDEPLWALVTASGILPPTALSRPRRRPVVFVADATPPERRARLAERADVLTAGDERPEPCRVLRLLRERHNCYHVLCEGGPRLNYSVLRAGALDELFLTFAPKLAAGGGKGILDGPQLPKDAFLRLRLISLFEHESELFFRYQAVRG